MFSFKKYPLVNKNKILVSLDLVMSSLKLSLGELFDWKKIIQNNLGFVVIQIRPTMPNDEIQFGHQPNYYFNNVSLKTPPFLIE